MASDKVQLPAEAVAAAHRGNLIEAIKLTRAKTGVGLKEAKDAVDAHLGTGRSSRFRRDESQDAAGNYLKRPILVALFAALIAVAAYLVGR